MSSTTTAQTPIDLAPQRPRPVLAFVLALLSVPGSTVVWDLDLPAPGLWIGLPLGLAAIVLGVRARRSGVRRGLATAAIVIGGLAIGQMALYMLVELVA